jgi:hypothetical protein
MCDAQWAQYLTDVAAYNVALPKYEQQLAVYNGILAQFQQNQTNYDNTVCNQSTTQAVDACFAAKKVMYDNMQTQQQVLNAMGVPVGPTAPTEPSCTPSHHVPKPPKPSPPTPGPTPPTPKHADELPVIAVMGVLIMGLIYWGTTR